MDGEPNDRTRRPLRRIRVIIYRARRVEKMRMTTMVTAGMAEDTWWPLPPEVGEPPGRPAAVPPSELRVTRNIYRNLKGTVCAALSVRIIQ